MCGICGFITKKNLDKQVLVEMGNTIRYRGPDDFGYHMEKESDGWLLGFAHNRLSILDLSLMGHQPMGDEDGTIWVCYNGEIYNFKEIKLELEGLGYSFKSNCDTEVIVYAYKEWGVGCVNRFNGMFAIAIWDAVEETIYLVRDRAGVKPLYYYTRLDGEMVFSSELKPIMKFPSFSKDLNMEALSEYLCYQYITGKETIFRGIYKLEPGTILKWHKGKSEIERYWSVEDVLSRNDGFCGTYEEAKKSLLDTALDATEKRMISDVAVGAFLSGGFDSTVTVAMMREISTSPIKTYTIGFNEERYNEAEYADAVAKKLGTQHHCRYLSMDDAKAVIDKLPYYYDEPMADSSSLAMMLLSETAKQDVTVVLSGDAGDELFCGYNKYTRFEEYRKIARIINTVNGIVPIRKILAGKVPRLINKVMYFDNPDAAVNADYLVYGDCYAGIVGNMWKSEKYEKMLSLSENYCEKFMYTDMVTWLPDDILTKVDRASMSVSLEARAPFLDYRIMELALNMPLEFKYKDGVKKRILKDIAYDYVGRELLDRPKKGFEAPIGEWMLQDFDRFTRGLLDEAYIRKQGIFNPDVIKKMVGKFKRQRKDDYGFAVNLWTIFVFQMWYEKYMAD